MAARTPAQNRALWSTVGRLVARGVPRDAADTALRRLCLEASGQESTKALSAAQAAQVLAGLDIELRRYDQPAAAPAAPVALPASSAHPVRAPRRSPRPGPSQSPVHGRNDADPPTPRQLVVLGALFEQAGFGTPKARMDWATRQCGRPWPQNQLDLDALLIPLQEMVLRRVSADDLSARLAVVAANPAALDAWLQGWVADVTERLSRSGARVWTTHRLAKLVEAEAQLAAAPVSRRA